MVLILSAFLAAASAQPVADMPVVNPNANQPSNCPAISRYEASGRGKTPRAKKLAELPMADLYRAVYRKIDGCEVPIIVKYGIGGR